MFPFDNTDIRKEEIYFAFINQEQGPYEGIFVLTFK